MKRFALIGENIGYTKSPPIHEAFYRVTGIDARYEVAPLAREAFAAFAESGYKQYDGFNVTKPYKEKIVPYIKKAAFSAVNTVLVRGGELAEGHNTDGEGFSLATADVDMAGKNVLLAGAGGAARAVAAEVLRRGGNLFVHNRTAERARALVAENGGALYAPDADVRYDVFINCTTQGQADDALSLPDVKIARTLTYIYDTVYRRTPLLALAEEKSIPHSDGYTMLVYQAVLSECLFNGIAYRDGLAREVFLEIS